MIWTTTLFDAQYQNNHTRTSLDCHKSCIEGVEPRNWPTYLKSKPCKINTVTLYGIKGVKLLEQDLGFSPKSCVRLLTPTLPGPRCVWACPCFEGLVLSCKKLWRHPCDEKKIHIWNSANFTSIEVRPTFRLILWLIT